MLWRKPVVHLLKGQFDTTATTNLDWTAKMLMKSPTSVTAGERLAQQAGALFSFLWLHAKQFYTAIKHRRGIATLADLDDRLLADIGLTRNDLRHAMAEPYWRDPSETLRRRARPALRPGSIHSLVRQPTDAVGLGSPNSMTMKSAA